MNFYISQIERTVSLDDKLANEYIKHLELREAPFLIAIFSKFDEAPTKDELSDDELSELCNEILLSELKACAMLPKAIAIIDEHYDQIIGRECFEIRLANSQK